MRLTWLVLLGLAVASPAAAQQGPSAADAEQEVPTRRYVVAAIGDSLTDPRAGGGKYLVELGARCPESRFDAFGVGGQQTAHMRQRFDRDVLQRHRRPEQRVQYTHVLVLGGINDLAYGSFRAPTITRTTRHLENMYQRARASGLGVVAVTLPPWGKLRGNFDRRGEATHALNQWIVAQRESGAVEHAVNVHPLLSCGDPDLLCASFRRFANDLVHWNTRGHAVVADALHREVFPDCR